MSQHILSTSTFSSSLYALILAAGKGTRMHSSRPKVLQTLLGEPMLRHVHQALQPLFGERVFAVIGHGSSEVEKEFKADSLKFIFQKERLGTGHAVSISLPTLLQSGASELMVINGDTPLISTDSVERFMAHCDTEKSDLAFISLTLKDPGSFGRVLRKKDGQVQAIIEAKDYNAALHGTEPREINAGIYYLKLDKLSPLLQSINNENKSGEYYLTDLVALAVSAGLKVTAFDDGDNPELLGINSPLELANSEELLRERLVLKLLTAGVIIHAPQTVRVSPSATPEPGAEIFGPCEIMGRSLLKRGCKVGPYCYIKDSEVGADSEVREFSHLEQAVVGQSCTVGPYARLRPGAELEEGSHVGNFVELKKTRLGKGAKANHLSYLGDSEIGAGSNIGAGTITCNYDGKNKFKTIIGENAFIGSNTALVAPINVGDNALVAAGSTLTEDVPPGQLAVARQRQVNKNRKR